MANYFISDLHFNHSKVSESRGFQTYQEHDAHLIRTINKVVNKTDDLYILGDITLSDNGLTWKDNLSIINHLNGRTHLISGNHDRCSVTQSNGHNYQAEFMKYFDSVSSFVKLTFNGQTYFLSHYPYDETDEAFSTAATNASDFEQFQLKDSGIPVIHGHTHSDTILTMSKIGTPQINVNIESIGFRPISFAEISKLLKK